MRRLMRHKSIRSTVLTTLAIVTLGLASLSLITEPVVRGQERPGQTNCAAESYAESLGISLKEAVRRLDLQNEMSDLLRIVRENEPEVAATWMVHQPDVGVVFAFTSPGGEAVIQKYLDGIEWADRVSVVQIEHTPEELVEILHIVGPAIESDLLDATGTNIPQGKIRLYTSDPERLRAQVSEVPAAQPYLDMIEYVYPAGAIVPAIDESDAPALSAISPQSSQPQPDSPLPPNVPALLDREVLENRWRWVEATDRGMSVLTSALPTVYVSFTTGVDIYATTELNLLSGHCFEWRYEVTGIPEAFTLSSAGFHRASCGDCVKAQFFWVKSVLERATSYAIEDDQLILHGEDAVIVLEMDNPSQKEAIGVMPHRVGIAHLDTGCPSEQQID